MRYAVGVAVVAGFSLTFLHPAPAHAQSGNATARWERGNFDITVDPNTGQDNKFEQAEPGSTAKVGIVNGNGEAKCTSSRADGAKPTSAAAGGQFAQEVVWNPGANNKPPERYFDVDFIRGVEAKANPYRDESLPVNGRPGKAGATAQRQLSTSAVNTSQTTLIGRDSGNILFQADTGAGGATRYGLLFAVGSTSYADSIGETTATPPATEDGAPPPPPVTTYPEKACNSEGRAYGKTGDPKTHGRSNW